ncbi:50S ribosomal protein L28 [bacterium]|nr:50S ribosomal protein L28 [bacterium]
MAKKDELTGKKAMSGNLRSHAMNHSKRRFNLNLQKAIILDENGAKKTIRVTARTKKTLRKDNKLVAK